MSSLVVLEKKPASFVAMVTAFAGAVGGLLIGTSQGSPFIGLVVGAAVAAALAGIILSLEVKESLARWALFGVLLVLGLMFSGVAAAMVGAIYGAFFGWFIY